MAYCRWLSARTQQSILLPSEDQWQRAAQGDDGRAYPWGTKFDKSRCNFNTQGPTSVTHYPSGESPFHVMDMSGNVWEWCMTEWGSDQVNISSNHCPVLRGGSWGDYNEDILRAGYRAPGHFPNVSNLGLGFRLARS
jgi:formylglycine-generating enzyme required for sulfatase activity